jgi:hypothetical protein
MSIKDLMSREEAEALYKHQIDALLADDYKKFCELSETTHVTTHYGAWNYGAGTIKSLFADLPDCNCCASQIEWGRPMSEDVHDLKKSVLRDSELHLPNFDMDAIKPKEYRFTKAELEEFARRQLVANYGDPFYAEQK